MKKEDLRIVFMGTPEFAVETLRALVDNGYNIVGVVTQPDRPVGRHGSQLQPPAVKVFALEHGLPVLQPERMKDETFLEQLRALDANLQVVVAFRMLPEVVWAMPEYGTFNVHAALLPDYRGAAPIQWAVINGERQTGVTTFFLDHEIDTGRIILQRPFDIPADADAGYVYDGLMHLGAQLCLDTIAAILASDGHPAAMAQDDSRALHQAPKLNHDTGHIDWSRPAEEIHNLVRGLSPAPGAWTTIGAEDKAPAALKIYKTALTDMPTTLTPGTVVKQKQGLCIACADSLLRIVTLQMAGRKRMDAAAFANGMADLEKYSVS